MNLLILLTLVVPYKKRSDVEFDEENNDCRYDGFCENFDEKTFSKCFSLQAQSEIANSSSLLQVMRFLSISELLKHH